MSAKRPAKANPALERALGALLKGTEYDRTPTARRIPEPRACPFDGKTAGLVNDPNLIHGWRVVCSKCGASSAACRSASYAVALWNQRSA